MHRSFDHVFDTRCASYNEHCWYCKTSCDNCLQHATFGLKLSLPSHMELKFNFCSLKCKNCLVHTESSFELCIHIIGIHSNDFAAEEYQKLFHLQGHVALADSGCARFLMTVCVNHKSEYLVLYKEIGLSYKKYAEYFVSREGTFLQFLSNSNGVPTDEEFEDLKFGELTSSYIEMGMKCRELFKMKNFKCNSVAIPIGIDFRKDLFYENSISFPKELVVSPIQSFINSLYALRLVNGIENQHLLVETLANAASKQLEYLQKEKYEPDLELCKLSEEVLMEIIPGWLLKYYYSYFCI